MTKYKKIVTSNGRTQYWVDGKMKSVRELPDGLALRLQDGVEVEITNGEPKDETVVPQQDEIVKSEENDVPIDESVCIVCDKPATSKRFLQLKIVGMCREHRDALSTGKVVQLMREKGYIS